jgi:hypothetical protein
MNKERRSNQFGVNCRELQELIMGLRGASDILACKQVSYELSTLSGLVLTEI